jgi:hypothetical protein
VLTAVDERDALAALGCDAGECEVRAFLDHEAGRPGAAVMARHAEAVQRGALQSAKLTMEPRPFRIEEHRMADLDLDVAVAHRIVGAHALADALRPALEHAEPDPVPSIGENATDVM